MRSVTRPFMNQAPMGMMASMEWSRCIEWIKDSKAFAGLTDKELEALGAIGVTRRVAAGEMLVQAGQKADAFFLVTEGSVEVWVNKDGQKEVLAILGPGQLFGEMAMIFQDSPRLANVTAIAPTGFFRFGYDAFKGLEQTAPSTYRMIVDNLSQLADARSWTTPVELIFQNYISAFSEK